MKKWNTQKCNYCALQFSEDNTSSDRIQKAVDTLATTLTGEELKGLQNFAGTRIDYIINETLEFRSRIPESQVHLAMQLEGYLTGRPILQGAWYDRLSFVSNEPSWRPPLSYVGRARQNK